jgi:hypothetical protein
MNDIQPTETHTSDCSGYFLKAAELLPLADRIGDGCQAVAESHANKLDCSRRMRAPVSKAAQGAGNIMQALRDSLGGFFVGLGKRLEGRARRIAGHKVGDTITYRPIGQRHFQTSRIVAISEDFFGLTAVLDNGEQGRDCGMRVAALHFVNETHIFKRGEIK